MYLGGHSAAKISHYKYVEVLPIEEVIVQSTCPLTEAHQYTVPKSKNFYDIQSVLW